jgi:adenylate cyclase
MEQESIKRKLTTILAADVAGYSRMMSDDEEATLRTLKGHREIIDGLISKHHGSIFNTAGDSVLAEFGSTVEAVRCAISMQEELRVQNAEMSDERQMLFRIGVNVGDVMVEEDNLYGDGVNVAARLEGVAEPGGICISGSAFDQVKDKLSIGFEDIGPQKVKNIAQPIPAFRVVPGPVSVSATTTRKPASKNSWQRPGIAAAIVIIIIAGGLAWWQPWEKKDDTSLPELPRIAVLPFDNLSGAEDRDNRGGGIAGALASNITTALSRLPSLFVIARTETFRYRNTSLPVSQIAEELGVRYLLEGDVQVFSGDKVRANTRLIDAPTDKILWTGKFDRVINDSLTLQDEITLQVLDALNIELLDQRSTLLSAGGTKNLEAYLRFQSAIPHFTRFLKAENGEARRLFQEAIELDPEFAQAVYMLGNTYMQSARRRWDDPARNLAKAKELAEKAIAINPDAPGAYNLLAQLSLRARRYEEAIEFGEKAVALEPNNVIYNAIAGRNLLMAGRAEEALRLVQASIKRGPLAYPLAYRFEGQTYHALGRYEEALAAFQRYRSLDTKGPLPLVWLTLTYADLGRLEEARATARQLLEVNPRFSIQQTVNVLEYEDRTLPDHMAATFRQLGLPE